MNLWDEIIKSKKLERPEEVKEILCETMNVKSLRLSAVFKFLHRQGISREDALDIGLYLTLENLLEK